MAKTIKCKWQEQLEGLFKGKEEVEFLVNGNTYILKKNDLKSTIRGIHSLYDALSAKTAEDMLGEVRKLLSRKSGALKYAEYIIDSNFTFDA